MQRYLMRFLILSSNLFILWGCGTAYKNLQATTGNVASLQQFKPVFASALYKADIDVIGNHLSGLLLIKKMPDSTTRMVFSNEIGFKFFDFEFSPDGRSCESIAPAIAITKIFFIRLSPRPAGMLVPTRQSTEGS